MHCNYEFSMDITDIETNNKFHGKFVKSGCSAEMYAAHELLLPLYNM